MTRLLLSALLMASLAGPALAEDQRYAPEQSYNTIQGTLAFADDGTSLTIAGHATGFTPGLTYVSFGYGTGSVPRGTLACLPPQPNNLTAAQMFLGTWLPVGSKVRTLQTTNSGASYTPVGTIGTTSIRWDNAPGSNGALTPARYVLQTCGRLTRSDGNDNQEN